MKNLKQCRSGKDFVRLAKKSGAEVTNGKGSHAKVTNNRGIAIVPRHNKDLGRGLRSSLFKTFVKMGIVLLPFYCIAIQIFRHLYV